MADRSHIIYHGDPILLQSYVNKQCTVTAIDQSVHTGIVYTVDPVTQSFVILENANRPDQRLKFIMGHAVIRVDVLSGEAEKVPELFQPSLACFSPDFLAGRKMALMEYFNQNHFPVRENGDNIEMEDVFSLKPPYCNTDCVSEQPMVISAIDRLIWQFDNHSTGGWLQIPF